MYELLLRVIYANVGLYCAIAILLIVTGCGAARGGAVVTFPSATPPHSLTLPPVPCRIAKVPFPWQAYGLLVTLFDDMASGAARGSPWRTHTSALSPPPSAPLRSISLSLLQSLGSGRPGSSLSSTRCTLRWVGRGVSERGRWTQHAQCRSPPPPPPPPPHPSQALGDEGGAHGGEGVELADVHVEGSGGAADDAGDDDGEGFGGSRGKAAPPPVVRAPAGTFVIEEEDDAAAAAAAAAAATQSGAASAAPTAAGSARGLAAQVDAAETDAGSVAPQQLGTAAPSPSKRAE